MAELVDALDSKSCGLWPCQFKSDYPYHFEKRPVLSGLFFVNFIPGQPAGVHGADNSK